MMTPPRLRRSTHLYCNYCRGNMQEYGIKRCDLCLVDIGTKDPKIVSFFKSKFRLLIKCLCPREKYTALNHKELQ